jgi:hypothetical protein
MENPTFAKKLDRAAVLGEFKLAGSRDPDVLHAVRARLLSASMTTRKFGMGFMIVGLVFISLVVVVSQGSVPALIGAIIVFGPLVLFGWAQKSRGDGNIRLVDSIMAELS